MIAELIVCVALGVVDADTVRCIGGDADPPQGELLRLLGDGEPNVIGVDAPELRHRECLAELMLARLAEERLWELIEPGVVIEDSGVRDNTRNQRRLVRLRLPDGRTAGQVLMEEGYAGEWTVEAGQVDWCAPL